MKTQLASRGSVDTDELRGWLARPISRLRRRLVHFPQDAVHLRAVVRHEDGRAEVALALQLPSNTLAVSEEGADPRAAVTEAFAELERRLEKEEARLRRASAWRGSDEAFQRELIERAARHAPETLSGSETNRLRRDLAATERFVRRELRALEANGDLTWGELDPRDIVDTALECALERGAPTREQLLRCASAALRSEVAQARLRRREIHIEEDVPEVPPEREVSTLGSEILDFHQPDEDLRVEDLLAGVGQTPEEIEITAELAEALRDALSALPSSWRQALHLSQIEGFDEAALADALDRAPENVEPLLAQVRAFVRDRLTESGVLDDAPQSHAS